MITKQIMAATALAAAILGCVGFVQSKMHLDVGTIAPDFKLEAQDGKTYSLKSLTEKKPVFVIFWKERCPHNKLASSLYNSLAKAYQGKAQLVGVLWASLEGSKNWVKQFDVNYPMLSDADKATIQAYAFKKSIGVMQIGTNGKIEAVFPGYGAESMKNLNAAMAHVAGEKVADVDLSAAPTGLTWG